WISGFNEPAWIRSALAPLNRSRRPCNTSSRRDEGEGGDKNAEIRMTRSEGMTKSEVGISAPPLGACSVRISAFGFLSDLFCLPALGILLLSQSIVFASTNTSVPTIPPLRAPHGESAPA